MILMDKVLFILHPGEDLKLNHFEEEEVVVSYNVPWTGN